MAEEAFARAVDDGLKLTQRLVLPGGGGGAGLDPAAAHGAWLQHLLPSRRWPLAADARPLRTGTALPRWLPCRAAPPPAGLAAVPRCPFPLAAVPLTRPLQGPLLRANAGDEGDARGACWRLRAGPGARRAGRRGRAPRGGCAGRRRVGAEATRRVGGEHGWLGAMVP